MTKRFVVSGILVAAGLVAGPLAFFKGQVPDEKTASPIAALPLSFVENQGQWSEDVRFAARKGPMSVSVKRDGIDLVFRAGRAGGRDVPVSLCFEGASSGAVLSGGKRQETLYNFFRGADPVNWKTGVAGYGEVACRGIYAGVNLRLYEGKGHLEYDVELEPGADLSKVSVAVEGVEALAIDADGSLLMKTPFGELRQGVPVTWAVLPSGERQPIDCRYALRDGNRFGFQTPIRDPALTLVIDPPLSWSTVIGGSEDDTALCVAVVPQAGTLLVAGGTFSRGGPSPARPFPTVNPYDATYNGEGFIPLFGDVFWAKLTADGRHLLVSTFFGGNDDEWPCGIQADAQGNVYLAGTTYSTNFPTTSNPYSRTADNFAGNPFVAKFSPAGSTLLYSSLIGGTGADTATAMAISAGDFYVTGDTFSAGFPTTAGAWDRSWFEASAFAFRMHPGNAGASDLVWSTFVDSCSGNGLAIDSAGRVAVCGGAYADSVSNFPARVGATPEPGKTMPAGGFDTATPGGSEAFALILSADGAQVLEATFLGGDGPESASGIAWGRGDRIWIAGSTWSQNSFPIAGAFDAVSTSADGFVSVFSPDLSTLVASSFVGGSRDGEILSALAVSGDEATIAGSTISDDFPVTPDANAAGFGSFIGRIRWTGGTMDLSYASIVAPGRTDRNEDGIPYRWSSPLTGGLALDFSTAAVMVGDAWADYPTTPGVFDETHNGGTLDAGVTKAILRDQWVALAGIAGPYRPGGRLDFTVIVANPPGLFPESFHTELKAVLKDGVRMYQGGAPVRTWDDANLPPGGIALHPVSVRIPAGLTPGIYTLRIFSTKGSDTTQVDVASGTLAIE